MSLRTTILGRLPAPARHALRLLKGRAERWRVQRGPTRVLGPQYRRSRSLVELDITWACNLRCFNCNRSCEQAPTGEGMTVAQVARFVDESLGAHKRWDRIRILGGEPSLHPHLDDILAELLRYRAAVPEVRLVLVTNGYGDKVRAALSRVPAGIEIEDTGKESQVQPFMSFNVAPVDVAAYEGADFTNGCWVTEHCGVGVTPYGWYPCAIAGGIDRIFGLDRARPGLPADEDDMHDQLEAFCKLCGGFKRDLEAPLDRPVQSEAWKQAYERHRNRR